MARARFCLTGAALALSLVGISPVANSQTSSSTSAQTTQTQTSSGQVTQSTTVQTSYITTPTGAYETYLPSIPNAHEALALQAIMDAGITTRDIELILPLLRDLRNENHWLVANTDQAISDLVAARSSSEVKQTGTAAVQDAAQKFRDHRDHIWSTIADRIGAAKADTLRSIVNPPLGNPAFAQDFNERMARIDSLIAKLDSFGNGTQTASTTESTTSTTVTSGATDNGAPATQMNGNVVNASMGQTMPLAEMTAFQTVLAGAVDMPRPHLTIDDLVMLLEEKVLAGEALDVTDRIMPWYPGYLTPESIKYLHDTELHIWK